MTQVTHICWWILLSVTTITIGLMWVYIPAPPLRHGTLMPSHSNSRLLPHKLWRHHSLYPELYSYASCGRFPSVSDIRYAAETWQLLQLQAMNGSIYLYGAYWDERFEEPVVRILIYSDVLPLPRLYCQLWFSGDSEPHIEMADTLYAWKVMWKGPFPGVNEPYILSCRTRSTTSDPDETPAAVSVVAAPCDIAYNILNVQKAPIETPSLKNTTSAHNISVAVCVKSLHFRNDISVQLVEWLQIVKHFGAVKAFVYVLKLHPKTKRTLQFYEKSGFVVVTEVSHPPQISGIHFDQLTNMHHTLRRELLPLNDCLYRNLGQYDWLAVIDIDELIVPIRDDTWPKLIKEEIALAAEEQMLEEDGISLDALSFLNYYVLDGAQTDLVAPKYTRLLAHTWRARNPSPRDSCLKSFINTSSVIAMHNHIPMRCSGTKCKIRIVHSIDARLLHFREQCANGGQTCAEFTDVVRDDVMSKWRRQVLEEINVVIKNISLKS